MTTARPNSRSACPVRLIGGDSFSGLQASSPGWRCPHRLSPARPRSRIPRRSLLLKPDTSASVYPLLLKGAKEEAAKRGYELLQSHANGKLDAQVNELNTWIGQGIGGVIVLPLDNNAMAPLIEKAHAANVKFLDYSDRALPGTDGWVIFNNLQGAALVGTDAGRWVNRTLNGKAKVALLDSRDPADREGSDPRRDQGLEEGRAGRAGRRSARGGARGRLSHRDPVDAPGASRSERDPLYRRRRGLWAQRRPSCKPIPRPSGRTRCTSPAGTERFR